MKNDAPLEKGYRIHGRVQGVGFRWWARSHAVRLGLAGSIRNCADGTVEVHVRGPSGAVAEFTGLLGQGPPGATVTSLQEIPPAPPHEGFHIRR